MRIVGGEWGGRTLKSPSGSSTRPTSDRVRESIFNILTHSYGADFNRVADFFAGTGALGLEALSRGAQSCIFFEENKKVVQVLQENIEICGVSPTQIEICREAEPFKWRGYLKGMPSFLPLDLIFSDPPYNKNWVQKLATSVLDHPAAQSFLSPSCLWVCECAEDDKLPKLTHWKVEDEREFGDTKVYFLEHSIK